MLRVLHVLSQRPMLTGSGVTLDALVRCADRAGYQQRVIVGVPDDAEPVAVGGLAPDAIAPLYFGRGDLDFAVPGMSDVMPYPSTRFSRMTESQLARYRESWRRHLSAVVDEFLPDVIHSHHVWIVSSLIKDIAPDVPVVTHCHATGLRQMKLCPELAGDVRVGCARNQRFAVLHAGHQSDLGAALGIAAKSIAVVGAGYRDDLFHARGREAIGAGGIELAYAGKLSHAKGLPWLLDAVSRLDDVGPDDVGPDGATVTLHVAGSGSGPEADALAERMRALHPRVIAHGQLDQLALAALLRRTSVFVLPSFYEGVPLVLVEALACGNRLIATRLPGIVNVIAPHTGDWLEFIDLPRLRGIDQPVAEDLPPLVSSLTAALRRVAGRSPVTEHPDRLRRALAPFTWQAVFDRVEALWRDLSPRSPAGL